MRVEDWKVEEWDKVSVTGKGKLWKTLESQNEVPPPSKELNSIVKVAPGNFEE